MEQERMFTTQEIASACFKIGVDYDRCRLLIYELETTEENKETK